MVEGRLDERGGRGGRRGRGREMGERERDIVDGD